MIEQPIPSEQPSLPSRIAGSVLGVAEAAICARDAVVFSLAERCITTIPEGSSGNFLTNTHSHRTTGEQPGSSTITINTQHWMSGKSERADVVVTKDPVHGIGVIAIHRGNKTYETSPYDGSRAKGGIKARHALGILLRAWPTSFSDKGE